jgi:hypothetical protein
MRPNILFLALPLLISCGDKDDTGQDPPEGDADTDADADADTDADTDTGLPACTVADLVFSAEVRDPSGSPCSTCPADVPLDLVGVVSNPCSSDLTLTTGSSCLVTGWTVSEGHTGTTVLTGVPGCYEAETDWAVGAGGSVEESFDSFSTWQELVFRLDIVFGDSASTAASTRFDIDEF